MKLIAALSLVAGCSTESNLGNSIAELDAASSNCAWSTATELTEFGDARVERSPTEPSDLLELFYVSGDAPHDISYASRTTVNEPFVDRPLPLFNDPLGDDDDPAITADGLDLVFTSDRDGTLTVYETTRASRGEAWSPPHVALSAYWPLDPGHGLTMTRDGLRMYGQIMGMFMDLRRKSTSEQVHVYDNYQVVIDSPAIDDAMRTFYFNCGRTICSRKIVGTEPFPQTGEEFPVEMGTRDGAWDPWIEPGGTILFGAEHSLYRSSLRCR